MAPMLQHIGQSLGQLKSCWVGRYWNTATSYVNDTELFDAEPRLLVIDFSRRNFVIDVEPRLSFSGKKRARAEPRL